MTTPDRDELALYVMGEHDGDTAALEAALTGDGADATAARALLADEARFESLLRDAGAAADFCPGCRDLVRGDRCDACGAALRPGGYVVERVLVSNAHGRMYLARDADGRQVALKELAFVQAPSLDVVAAFEREAKFLRALEHPAIPRFVASFEEGLGVHTRYYLAQELVPGRSLAAVLDEHWFTEAEARDVARQVLRVLVYLQSLSPMIIHRDIKPANLLRRADGSIALVDFGAAHVQGATAGSTSIGTFGYMPIEQLAGVVDATTDVFALGASLLHLLSRQEPWRIVQARKLDGINVSPALRALLARMIAPEPGERFADAAAALAALDEQDESKDATAHAAVAAHAAAPPKRRRDVWRPILYAAASLALLGLGGAGFAVARRSLQERVRERAQPATAPFVGEVAFPDASLVEQKLQLEREVEAMRRAMAGDERVAHLPAGKSVDLAFKQVPLPELVRLLGDQCGVNTIVPAGVDAPVTVELRSVPCDQALEVLLESNGLGYQYVADANLVRIAPRRQLDDERRERAERRMLGIVDDELPPGPPIDLDVHGAPLADVLQTFARAGRVNVVLPAGLDARVTVRGKAMPWAPALEAVLASQGLWYRYWPNGKLVRIAPRRQLDDEARERGELRELEPGMPAPAVAPTP